ncbi:hypothetical protein BPUTSESOX_1518 [uncultured Gammaproteobacteria bacterium]|nr:hypothetical protein [uncultured Gammaproteobacteria bacterium]CAC9497401.1 hypothetical protein [uncultured Gammaproteobacteria bacterium]VVH51547.1 hypothetical protein BPUTSESOX_1518 [uncultured Gammaproteobacteria bacterium]
MKPDSFLFFIQISFLPDFIHLSSCNTGIDFLLFYLTQNG